jgi:hypothetical protein
MGQELFGGREPPDVAGLAEDRGDPDDPTGRGVRRSMAHLGEFRPDGCVQLSDLAIEAGDLSGQRPDLSGQRQLKGQTATLVRAALIRTLTRSLPRMPRLARRTSSISAS